MKKLLGYGFRLSRDNLSNVIYYYGYLYLDKSKKEVLKGIIYDKKTGMIAKNSKPRIFRVIIEDINE